MVRSVDGRLAVDHAHAQAVAAQARVRVLLAGDLGAGGRDRPGLLERLASRLRRVGDVVVTTSARPGPAWRVLDMLVTTLTARSRVDVAVVEVRGQGGLRRAEFLSRLLSSAGVPVVHLLRGADLADLDADKAARLRALLESGSASVALTGHLHESLSELGGVSTVIADPVETSAYAFRPRRAVAPRLLWSHGQRCPCDATEAADVAADLSSDRTDTEVTLVVGAAPDVTRRVEEAAMSRGVPGKVHVLDFARAAGSRELLETHDVFVNAADVDEAELGLMEAMAAGLCVVAVDWGGASYLVVDGVDGLLVGPREQGGVASAVRRLLDDPGLAERLSRAARAKAETHDWARALPRWRGVLTSAVKSGGASSRRGAA